MQKLWQTVEKEQLQQINTCYLANLDLDQGKYEQAEPLYQRALCIRKLSLGLEHFLTQTIRKNYPRLLQAIGRNEQAQRLEELS